MSSHLIPINYLTSVFTRIPRLLSFLLHYSIFNGFSIDTCVHLAPDLLRHIGSSCNLAVKKTIELLGFKEKLSLYLLRLHEKDGRSLDDLWGALLETTESHGILGFLIVSVSNTSQVSKYSHHMILIAHSWLERQGRFGSTMTMFTQDLLFTDGPSNQRSKLSYNLDKADMQVRLTLATAMVERNHFAQAHAILTACAKDLRSLDPVYKNEYFPVMTELIKTCNILNQAEQGEAIALEALQHRQTDNATPSEISHLQVALADSLVGQSKYSEADKVLESLLASESLSAYLATVVSLRLNKVRRRLGILDVPAFIRNGELRKVLLYTSDSEGHIIDECLEELSCTISFTQQSVDEDPAVAKALLDTAVAVVARQPISTSDWRTRMLHEQTMHDPGHKVQDEQVCHQYPAERLASAQNSQKCAPLRILLLREVLETNARGQHFLSKSQALSRPMLALDSMVDFLVAKESHGNFSTLKMIAYTKLLQILHQQHSQSLTSRLAH